MGAEINDREAIIAMGQDCRERLARVEQNYNTRLRELEDVYDRAERAEARVKKLEEALEAYDRWASSMPDAGFSDKSPRWAWWLKRPATIAHAALSDARLDGANKP